MMAHPGGRPPIFNSPKELESAIDSYFMLCDSRTRTRTIQMPEGKSITEEVPDPEVYTITGLALHLGFASKQSLYDYEEKEEYSYPIKRAKTRIENQVEREARTVTHPAGQIFILKNFGWKDKQEIDQSNHYPEGIQIRFVDSCSNEQ